MGKAVGSYALHAVPPGTFDSLHILLDRLAQHGALHGEMAVLLDANSQALIPRWRRQTSAGMVGGWRAVGGEIGPWTSFIQKPLPAVHLGFLDRLEPRRTALFHPRNDPPALMVERLEQFNEYTGAAWQMTAGVSGCASIRRLVGRRKGGLPKGAPHWGVGARRGVADERQAAGDIGWSRVLTRIERECQWVHGYDLNAARLAATGVADLPYERLSHVEGAPFDPALGGYWLVRVEDIPGDHRARPQLVPRSNRVGNLAWLTTPVMKELMDRGHLPDVLEAYVSPAKRWLYAWANRIDKARLHAWENYGKTHPLYRSLRGVWTETIGMIERDGGSISLPVVAHTIIDRQRVTVSRHIDAIYQRLRLYPVRVMTDAIYYASHNENAESFAQELGITLGRGLGQFKPIQGYPVPMDVWQEGPESVSAYVNAERAILDGSR